jgi:hypothetical protein
MSPAAPMSRRRWVAGLAALALLAGFAATAAAQDARRRQEILFDELPPRSAGDAPFLLSAKATSGLAVTFELVDGPATLDGRLLKLTGGSGLVIIRASQKGNETFLPAPTTERVFSVGARPVAPAIMVPPAGAAVALGEPVILEVQVSGEPLPSLQWRKNGEAIAGATSRNLTFASATMADAGAYDVVATNRLGSVHSAAVRVTVGKRHQMIVFTPPPIVTAGQPIVLSASASSGLPVHFVVVGGTASLSGGTLTPNGGMVVVQATQDGDDSYEAASPVTQTFQVQAGPIGQQHY